MSKEKDYLDKIEVHRQEVELDEVSRRRTRTRGSRKQNKAPKITSLKILVVIFIFIPLSLLGYVWLFYEPEVETVTPEIDNSIVHIETNNMPSSSANVEEDEEDKNEEEQDSSNTSNEEEEQDSSNDSTSTEDVEVNKEEEQAIDKAAQEAEEKLKAEQQKAEDKTNEQSANASNGSNSKTHVVQAKDTLYSIAMKYYKDPTKVDAIKKANNLSSNSIPLGKELILP